MTEERIWLQFLIQYTAGHHNRIKVSDPALPRASKTPLNRIQSETTSTNGSICSLLYKLLNLKSYSASSSLSKYQHQFFSL